MTTTLDEQKAWLREQAASDGITFFLAMFVDMHGKPCAKLVPACLEMLLSTGAGLPASRWGAPARAGHHHPRRP